MLACAHLLAGRFGGHIQGFAFFPLMYEVYGFGDMTPLWVTEGRPSEELAGEARKVFDQSMREEAPSGAGGAPIPSAGSPVSDPGDIFVASHARVFDITILGRPGYDPSGPRSSTLEAVLFESGRPCLIAPPTPPRELGDNIVIAWNRSTETALAVAHAMPLLHQAKRVTILTVEGGSVPGPSGDELANGLKLNGIETQAVTVNPGKRTSGEMISQLIGLDRRRPPHQRRLYAKPSAPDDLRRRDEPHPRQRELARVHGALRLCRRAFPLSRERAAVVRLKPLRSCPRRRASRLTQAHTTSLDFAFPGMSGVRLRNERGRWRRRPVSAGRGGDELARIGMARPLQHLLGPSEFHDFALPHHGDVVRDLRRDAKVVEDETSVRSKAGLQIGDQAQDLGSHGDVERRDAFIGEDDLGVHGERGPMPMR